MKYQVGRACAVAGYFDLYKVLELLPDVHIFEGITNAHVKYSVMNGCERTVDIDNPKMVPYLNGEIPPCGHPWRGTRSMD